MKTETVRKCRIAKEVLGDIIKDCKLRRDIAKGYPDHGIVDSWCQKIEILEWVRDLVGELDDNR